MPETTEVTAHPPIEWAYAGSHSNRYGSVSQTGWYVLDPATDTAHGPYFTKDDAEAHVLIAERAARVRESWFVENPACLDIVLLASSPRANYQYLCSCGHHGTIASLNLAYAREVCATHLRGHVVPGDPFEGLA